MSGEEKRDSANGAARRLPLPDGSGREAVLLSIKQALVKSRLTLAENDAGSDPYNTRRGPGSVWVRRSRY
jgi:hypothetical protein